MAAEGKQRVIGGMDASHVFEQQPGGKKSEGHSVTAVSEREQMTRIAMMRPNVREAVGRHGEQALPCVVDTNVGQGRKHSLKVVTQFPRGPGEHGPPPATRHKWTVGASKEQ